jgi:site-specific DNA-methyltransferase (adenine-specific)
MVDKALFTSSTGSWETPQDFFDKLDGEFLFELDPCATKRNAKCKRYYNRRQNGLVKPWAPWRTFVNPPYGRGVGAWVEKAYNEYRKGAIVVMLLPARTDTLWFHKYIYHEAEIRFVKGRLRFGGACNPAPFPSMVIVFKPPRFLGDFEKLERAIRRADAILERGSREN